MLAGNGWMRGVQRTREPVVIVLVANALSAVLCPVLVYPAGLGLDGLGRSPTSVAQAIGAALFLRALRRAAPAALRPHRAVMRAQLVVGRDLILRAAAFQVAFLTAAGVAVADRAPRRSRAHQIGLQLWEFTALLLDSFAIAAQSLVGAALGGSDAATARAHGLAGRRGGGSTPASRSPRCSPPAGCVIPEAVHLVARRCSTRRTCCGRGSSACCPPPAWCSRSTAC